MSFLSMVEAELPPGFRFHPRDDELICDYLAPKLGGRVGFSGHCPPMVDVDLNQVEPWDLPAAALVGAKEWYFFCLIDRKYTTGKRTNRATVSGYWKATGKDRLITRRGVPVGMRKMLVFHQGRAPKGVKTEWVMNEYRTECEHEQPSKAEGVILDKKDWVLCRVICKKESGGDAAFNTNRISHIINGHGHGTATAAASAPPLTPPLMGFTLAQVQAAMNAGTGGAGADALKQQPPCFSFSNIAKSSSSSAAVAAQPACYLPMATGNNGGMGYLDHGLPELPSYTSDPLSCDEKLLESVLSNLGAEVVPSLPPGMASPASSTWVGYF
ncbi:hypothetical protein ACP4OV_029821 [Aristida adscensionis]